MYRPTLKTQLMELASGRQKMLHFVEAVASSDASEREIRDALEHAFTTSDWPTLQALVLVCSRRPSVAFTEILCRILSAHSPEMTNEDVVEVLHENGDPSSISSLRAAADLELPGDDVAHHFNRKCVAALARIASGPALVALRDIAESSPFLEVREEAASAFHRLKGDSST